MRYGYYFLSRTGVIYGVPICFDKNGRKDEDLVLLAFVVYQNRGNVHKLHIAISPLACINCKWGDCSQNDYLFHLFKQSDEAVKLTRVNFQIDQFAVAIEELVSGERANTKIALDGSLLFIGQVIVSHIVADYIILFDDILP